VPTCDANGNYSTTQCDNNAGVCWCASPDGREVVGTRHNDDSTTAINCNNLPPCLAIGHAARLTGGFVPECTSTGLYNDLQCISSTGQCWCVLPNGDEVPFSRSYNTSLDCANLHVTWSKEFDTAKLGITLALGLGGSAVVGSFLFVYLRKKWRARRAKVKGSALERTALRYETKTMS